MPRCYQRTAKSRAPLHPIPADHFVAPPLQFGARVSALSTPGITPPSCHNHNGDESKWHRLELACVINALQRAPTSTPAGTPILLACARNAMRYSPPMTTHISKISGALITLTLTLFAAAAPRAHAQAPASKARAAAAIQSLPQAKTISEAALAPDGTKVAVIADDQLSLAAVSTGPEGVFPYDHSQPITARDVAWSADSKSLAFIADVPGDDPARSEER